MVKNTAPAIQDGQGGFTLQRAPRVVPREPPAAVCPSANTHLTLASRVASPTAVAGVSSAIAAWGALSTVLTGVTVAGVGSNLRAWQGRLFAQLERWSACVKQELGRRRGWSPSVCVAATHLALASRVASPTAVAGVGGAITAWGAQAAILARVDGAGVRSNLRAWLLSWNVSMHQARVGGCGEWSLAVKWPARHEQPTLGVSSPATQHYGKQAA